MWERFKRRLGKIVQGIKAIFGRRGNNANAQEKNLKWDDACLSMDTPVFKLSPMEGRTVTFTCNNATINKDLLDSLSNTKKRYDENTLFDEVVQLVDGCMTHSDLIMNTSGQVDSKWKEIIGEEAFALLEDIMEELKISANKSRTNLPKRIKTKALIISVAINQPYEYVAADLSQLEEKGLAHLIHGIKDSRQEKWELEKKCMTEEEAAEVEEYLRQYDDDNELISSIIPGATLLYYEDLNLWDYEE